MNELPNESFRVKYRTLLTFLGGFCLGVMFSFAFLFTPSKFHVSDYVKVTQGAGKGCEGVIRKFQSSHLINVFIVSCPFPTEKKFVDIPEEYLELKND
jgi:hypothetical protein